MDTMDVILRALFAFAGVKFVFAAIGWYTRDAEDQAIRGRLDALFDRIDAIRAGDLAHRFLSRFVIRWGATFSGKRGAARFIGMSFCANFLALGLGFLFGSNDIYGDPLPEPRPLPEIEDWAFVAKYGLVGLVPDVISGGLSLWLIKFALRRPRIHRILAVCILDALLLSLAASINIFLIYRINFGATSLRGLLWDTRQVFHNMPELWLIFATASVQTLLYLILGFCVALARLCPRRLQSLFARTVYNISVADKPVFSQLGDMCGALAAMLTAIGAILRSS